MDGLLSPSSSKSNGLSDFDGVEMIERGDSRSLSSTAATDCGEIEWFRRLGNSNPFSCSASNAADVSGAPEGHRRAGGDSVDMIL